MEKETFYITVGSGEISKIRTASPFDLVIEATEDEISTLRELFDQQYSTEWQGFFRAHIPYIQYHHDKPNDAYDAGIKQVYQKLHELGTNETKEHIESMGILD